MDNEKRMFLNLLSSFFSGEKNIADGINFNIETLQMISERNKCLSFIYQGCVNNYLSVPASWRRAVSFCGLDSYRKLRVESEIISLLKKNSIRSCVLKGSSVAINYPNPIIRSMGDIDILVDEFNYKKAALLFISNEQFIENEHDFHISFFYENVNVEIHKFFTDYDYTDDNLCKFLESAMDNIECKKLDVFDIPMLKVNYQAVSLVTHMIRHFRDNEFVFRMFCDWVYFVKSLSDSEWSSIVYPTLKEFKYDIFADAINIVAEKYLNIKLNVSFTNKIDDDVILALVDELLSINKANNCGSINSNLGAKYSIYRQSNNGFISAIKVIIDISKQKYKLSQNKIFLPIICFYIMIRYFVGMIFSDRAVVSFRAIKSNINRRKKIYSALNIRF